VNLGPIDVFVANAGISILGGVDTSNTEWTKIWDINVGQLANVSRYVVPLMLKRGRGHIVVTASAAGILTQFGSLPYSVTKHAALAFAEWLAITHGAQGLKVHCICPQGVQTAMSDWYTSNNMSVARSVGTHILQPTDVADCLMNAMKDDIVLVLPHAEVKKYAVFKAQEHQKWIVAMRKLQNEFGIKANL